jgi:hypothetical protein
MKNRPVQALSRRLLTAPARVRAPVKSCGICGRQSGTGVSFLKVLRFPVPILIQPTSPHSSSIIRAGVTGQIVADVPSGFTSPHPKGGNKVFKINGRHCLCYSKLIFFFFQNLFFEFTVIDSGHVFLHLYQNHIVLLSCAYSKENR